MSSWNRSSCTRVLSCKDCQTALIRPLHANSSLRKPCLRSGVQDVQPRPQGLVTVPLQALPGDRQAGPATPYSEVKPAESMPSTNDASDKQGVSSDEAGETSESQSVPVRMALGMLQFYRQGISPLMPSTCRYIPSCSQYSIASYKKFGFWRGSVLTAWRLARCNPLGSSGYDPPQWPPKGLEAVYRLPYSPEVSTILGAALFVYLVNGLWHSIFT